MNMYLASILCMPTSISESDIIYTFLHCLIRDEQDLAKLSEGECAERLGMVYVHTYVRTYVYVAVTDRKQTLA